MAGNAWAVVRETGRWLFAALFVAGGINHLVSPEFYLKIVPPYLPYHRALVFWSGVFEVLLGVLLVVPPASRLAAWGLVALLIAVFPANLYMYQHAEKFPFPPVALLLRLPLQGLLIYWLHVYTKK